MLYEKEIKLKKVIGIALGVIIIASAFLIDGGAEANMTVPENDGPYHRVFLPMGPEDGALYYKAGFPGPDLKPSRFLVDAGGNAYFLEYQVPSSDPGSSHSRIQKFSPQGKFLLAFDWGALEQRVLEMGGLPVLSGGFRVSKIVPGTNEQILALAKGLSKADGKLAVFVGVYDASGRLQRVYRLEEQAWLPEPFENVHLDDGGYLWVQQPPHLLVFDPRGVRQYAADWPLGLVDADGHNYVTRTIDPDVSSASETVVFDRAGKKVATLVFPAETGPVQIDGGDARTFLLSWVDESGDERTGRPRARVLRLDKRRWQLTYAGEVFLPKVRVVAGDPFDVPVEDSEREHTVVQGNNLYTLWNSDKQYWLLKIDIEDYLKRYGYLSKFASYLTEDADLNKGTVKELRQLRNEIFARHGRAFSSKDLKEHFEAQPWYKVDPTFTEDRLSSVERELVDRLTELERRNASR